MVSSRVASRQTKISLSLKRKLDQYIDDEVMLNKRKVGSYRRKKFKQSSYAEISHKVASILNNLEKSQIGRDIIKRALLK